MIIALNTSAEAEPILAALRAGINEYLVSPLHDPLKRALEKRSADRSRRRESGAKAAARASPSSPRKADAAPARWSATWPRSSAG